MGSPPIVVRTGDCLIIRQGVEGILGDAPDRVAVSCWQIADHVTGQRVTFGGGGEVAEFFSTLFTFNPSAGLPLLPLPPASCPAPMPAAVIGRDVSIL